MSVDDVEDSVPAMSVDSEIKELMGLFDVPALRVARTWSTL